MVWKRFWKRPDPEPDAGGEPQPEREPAPAAGRELPAHLARQVERRPAGTDGDPNAARRQIAAMERQRLAMLYDIEQGELAVAGDNPWKDRIDLLSQAMETVTDDLKTLKQAPPGPFFPLPATPIVIDEVVTDPAASVRFTIGTETFAYVEERDWAERGHQMIRTELIRRAGEPAPLVPGGVPGDLREPLLRHLTDSLFVFASDLRDRTLDGEPLPDAATLADLGRPCPRCGGWTDWRGTCQVCASRAAEAAALKREERRLLDERASEAEEQHRLAERLPLARRRLRDLDARIATLSSSDT
ncbi:MAG: hypothetical protein H0W23_06790 [Chloroflexia bacterium]|nr:hypothetical protein [Chloroflexia bacterium]